MKNFIQDVIHWAIKLKIFSKRWFQQAIKEIMKSYPPNFELVYGNWKDFKKTGKILREYLKNLQDNSRNKTEISEKFWRISE